MDVRNGIGILLIVLTATFVEGFHSTTIAMAVSRKLAPSSSTENHTHKMSSRADTSVTSSSEESIVTDSHSDSSAKIRGIIFDIDGTLADSWNLGFQATLTVLTDYHNNQTNSKDTTFTPQTYPLTEEQYHYGCRYTTPERLARHVGLEPVDSCFQSVGELLGKQFDEYYVKLVDRNTAKFYNGISDLLIRLHSGSVASTERTNYAESNGNTIKLGALTNACVEYAHAVLKANCPLYSVDNMGLTIATTNVNERECGIYHRFSSIHGANSVPRPKPYGDGIVKCCSEMNLLPSQVLYIGDSPTDAQAAVDANCRGAIGVLWGSNDEECLSKEKGFSTLCRDLKELEQAIVRYL